MLRYRKQYYSIESKKETSRSRTIKRSREKRKVNDLQLEVLKFSSEESLHANSLRADVQKGEVENNNKMSAEQDSTVQYLVLVQSFNNP